MVKSIVRKLRSTGYECMVEPRIPVGNTVAKPDIVARRRSDGKVTVLDPTIVSDKRDLEWAAQDKVDIYSTDAVFRWLTESFGESGSRAKVEVAGIAIDWRGAWASSSVQTLKALGVPMSFLELLSFRALKYAYNIYASLRNRTW